jgi:hypothetical protein
MRKDPVEIVAIPGFDPIFRETFRKFFIDHISEMLSVIGFLAADLENARFPFPIKRKVLPHLTPPAGTQTWISAALLLASMTSPA